jgi:hypothetical protein
MSAEQAIQHFLSLLPEDVARELTIVPASKLDPACLLHISKDTAIPAFTPTVTRRGMEMENRSVPRVSTAPSLVGCIMGYSSDLYDFMEQPNSVSADRQRKIKYRGGWGIYGIPFQFALRPSKKLLPDAARTDEHWLVTYDEATVKYEPQLVGKFFYEVVTYRAGRDLPQVEVEMIVEVLTDTPIRFDNKTVLKRGFHRLLIKGMHNADRWDKIPVVEAREINRVEYSASKQLVASMLSFENLAPASADW